MNKLAMHVLAITLLVAATGFGQVTQEWAQRYTAITNAGWGINVSDMTIDAQGNVYTTGFAGTDSVNIITTKYNSQGQLQSVWSYNDSLNTVDIVTSIVVDGAGNVYVTGYSYFNFSGGWMMTYKYNSSGIQVWSRRFQAQAGALAIGNDIAVDVAGNVYVVGTTVFDMLLVKYDAAGVLQWFRRIDGTLNAGDEGMKVEIDNAGNIVAAGSAGGGGGTDFMTVKYNPDGDNLWFRRFDISGVGGDDYIRDMAIDNTGNIYVAGRGNSGLDFATVKYDAFGTFQWSATYHAPGTVSDEARGIAVDNAGNVYVTGSDIGNGRPPSAYTIVKYNVNGIQQWVRNYRGPISGESQAYDIAADIQGNVYVTGQTFVGNNSNSIATVKYSTAGDSLWEIRYNTGVQGSISQGGFVRVDGSGNVFVSGTTVQPFVTSDYATIKYSQGPTSVDDGREMPTKFDLEQNYPNPFNPATTIRFQIPSTSVVTLRVFDVLGREVEALVNVEKNAGTYSIQWNAGSAASGVYFYQLKAGTYTETRKLLLMK